MKAYAIQISDHPNYRHLHKPFWLSLIRATEEEVLQAFCNILGDQASWETMQEHGCTVVEIDIKRMEEKS